jgi:ubiquinone/menaquinone biosynthesis C-methylase UbiE
MIDFFVRLVLLVRRIPLLNQIFWSGLRPINKDQEYWKTSLDARVERELVFLIKWPVDRLLWTWRFSIPLGKIYLERDNTALWEMIDDMIAQDLVPPLNKTSHLLESGCNVAAILKQAAARYNCRVSGLDISEQAITYARTHTFSGNRSATFYVQDVLDWSFFRQFPDNHFSHVICASHLVHVPSGAAKDAYIEELKRIGQCVILFEKLRTDNDPISHDLFPENYSEQYGFSIFRIIKKNHKKYDKQVGLHYIKTAP